MALVDVELETLLSEPDALTTRPPDLRIALSRVVVVVVLLFDIVYEKTKEHKSITIQKDVKEHRITVRFSSHGALLI